MNRNNEKAVRTLPFFLCGIFLVVICGLYGAVSALNAAAQFEDNLLFVLYELLFPASVITALFAALLWSRKGDRMYRAYAFSAMVLGVLYLAVMPGLSAPDELSHYSTAYRISSNMMLEDPLIRPAGLTAVRAVDYPLEDMNGVKTPLVPDDEESVPEVLGNPVKQTTYRAVKDWDKRYAFSTKPVASAIPDVHTTPVFYLPQAIGFSIARALGLGTMGLLFLGKFLNLCCYVALTALAVRTTPLGKGWFAAAGLLPMSVSLAASLSYDAGLIGTVFLFTALIFKLAYGAEEIRARELFALCALAALFGPCKLVYAPLILLLWLVPARVFGGGGKKLLCFLILLLSLIAAVLAVNADVLEAYFFPAVAAQTGNVSADLRHAGFTAAELFSHPLFTLRMLLNSFSACILTWGGEMIGTKLGNLDPLLGASGLQTLFFALGLFCLTVADSTGETVRILVPGTRAARRAAREREESERAAAGAEALPETGTGAVAAETTQAEDSAQAEMETALDAVSQQAAAGEVLTAPLGEHVAEAAETLREAEAAVAAQAAASEAVSAAEEADENALPHYIEVGVPGRIARLFAFLVGALSFFGVLGAMLLAWTSRDAVWIEGVQGRYFLPLLPVFLFSLQSRMLQSRLPFKRLVPYGFVILNLCVGIRIFALAVLRV
ncbi:hypothetical protein HMPREF9623_01162 [Stomatobaculum longum]|uniref:DUF2142 domain-containing protein n=1 Tax=Stomatobaculum longum TaxID=796942 RepID=A0AA36Y4C7_9FIRM|nr:DUF2142 domain-containing protein [Stomatobaculum longum]EHO16463.1 hypothetical protein HMPREF9623_01162 [Stomatobaculum longum]